MKELRKIIYNQHDVICNQKYGDNLPYSFHLDCVEKQGEEFIHLIENKSIEDSLDYRNAHISFKSIVRVSLLMHDIIEDGRFTYNDVVKITNAEFGNYSASVQVADIVYCVTDEKGKNRAERKNDKYYKELSGNKLAVFVKLADLAANTLYSKLTGSSMYDKYKIEFPKFKEKVYIEEYKEFFEHIENL